MEAFPECDIPLGTGDTGVWWAQSLPSLQLPPGWGKGSVKPLHGRAGLARDEQYSLTGMDNVVHVRCSGHQTGFPEGPLTIYSLQNTVLRPDLQSQNVPLVTISNGSRSLNGNVHIFTFFLCSQIHIESQILTGRLFGKTSKHFSLFKGFGWWGLYPHTRN